MITRIFIFIILASLPSALFSMTFLESLGYSEIQKTSSIHENTEIITDTYSIYFENERVAYVTSQKNFIHKLYVDRKHRKQKLGSHIFLHVLNDIQNKNYEQAEWVAEDSIFYYQRFGASPIKVLAGNGNWLKIKGKSEDAYEKYRKATFIYMVLDFKKIPNPDEYYDKALAQQNK